MNCEMRGAAICGGGRPVVLLFERRPLTSPQPGHTVSAD